MSKPSILCIYCGEKGVTKEHIRGAWSRKYELPNNANPQKQRNVHILRRYPTGLFHELPVLSKGSADRPGTSRSLTLKIACKNCNNGWMKNIVDDAIPVLKPISFGYWGSISPEAQTNLARWITLYVMSFEYADRESVCVSQRERDEFRTTGIPTDNWDIAIGYVEGNPGVEPIIHTAFELWGRPDWNGHRRGQITACVFGKMIAVARYSEYKMSFSFEDYAKKLGLIPIWPLKNGANIHKPFRIHYDESVDQCIKDFSTLLQASE